MFCYAASCAYRFHDEDREVEYVLDVTYEVDDNRTHPLSFTVEKIIDWPCDPKRGIELTATDEDDQALLDLWVHKRIKWDQPGSAHMDAIRERCAEDAEQMREASAERWESNRLAAYLGK